MLFNCEFDFICSIGEDCACSSYLRRFYLQNATFPFDWLTKASFETRIKMITTDFQGFLVKENLLKIEKTAKFVDEKNDYYHDKVHDFYFYHDFDNTMPFDAIYSIVKNKYNRRIERFYKRIQDGNNILFVWWSRDKKQSDQVINESYEKLVAKFPNKNIYMLLIEFAKEKEEIYYKNNNVLILRYDNISYDIKKSEQAVLGNIKNNVKVFAQIKRKMKFNDIKNIGILKICKFFIAFIPNKTYRNKLKKTIEFKFYRNKL